ncbi:MAG: trypsin-like peptidase domain-containing protein [Deltaproteobacteria bacterium]|nr:trypsin-like peptidase domain-containing protein [Deltaproteobacteria bacterium]
MRLTNAFEYILLSLFSLSCTSISEDESVEYELLQDENFVINGFDSRKEYFEIENLKVKTAMQKYAVALIGGEHISSLLTGDSSHLPSWREMNNLCSEVPFSDQPAVAFCSGVLVDSDLVLTSAHCLDVIHEKEIKIVFNYYYEKKSFLKINESDIYDIKEIVAISPPILENDSVDYAWIRLNGKPGFYQEPSPVFTHWHELHENDSIITFAASGGVPMKLDDEGTIADVRNDFGDYFVASTDTFKGASGGGAWNSQLQLIGIFSRGIYDYQRTDAACNELAISQEANEHFTYIHRAIEGLCEVESNSHLCKQIPSTPNVLNSESTHGNASSNNCMFSIFQPREYVITHLIGLFIN